MKNRKDLKVFHYEDQNHKYVYILQDSISTCNIHIREIKDDKDFAILLKNDFANFALRERGLVEPKYNDCADMFRYGDFRDEGYVLSGEIMFSDELLKSIRESSTTKPELLKLIDEVGGARVERSCVDFYAVQHAFADIDRIMYYVERPDELE